jgi:hypothetical protein
MDLVDWCHGFLKWGSVVLLVLVDQNTVYELKEGVNHGRDWFQVLENNFKYPNFRVLSRQCNCRFVHCRVSGKQYLCMIVISYGQVEELVYYAGLKEHLFITMWLHNTYFVFWKFSNPGDTTWSTCTAHVGAMQAMWGQGVEVPSEQCVRHPPGRVPSTVSPRRCFPWSSTAPSDANTRNLGHRARAEWRCTSINRMTGTFYD